MGRPPKRCSKALAQISTASGVFSSSPCSPVWEPAGTSRQKCFWSAQSMAANAAHSRSVVTGGNESDMVSISLGTGWLGSHESLIVESRSRQLLRVRHWNQAHPAARSTPGKQPVDRKSVVQGKSVDL